MRHICYTCLRPMQSCLCTYLTPFDCGVKFGFLMHPKEAKRQRTGTGRIAHAALIDSEIIVGIDFSRNERLCALLADERYFPVLLYPGDEAWTAGKDGFTRAVGTKKLLVIIIDSTWFCSKKMLQLSTNVTALPRLSFGGAYRSIFTFKREPKPEYISTIESCYYLIKELKAAAVVRTDADPECLMTAFKAMIRFQLQKENERVAGLLPNTHFHDYKYTRTKVVPTFD